MDDRADLAHAYESLQQHSLPKAEALCRGVLARSPDHADALHLLGLIRKEAGDTAAGERLLRQSIGLRPQRADFRGNLGNLLRQLGRLREAERCYREALALDSQHRPARFGLALTQSDLGAHGAAEAECRTLLASDARDSRAWSMLAGTLRAQGRLPEAESALRRAIDVDPGHAVAHQNLGSLLSHLERAEEALQALQRAQSLGLAGFELAFNRGRTLLQLCRADEAERAFAAAVTLQPGHAEAQLNLARVRFMLGDPLFTRDIQAALASSRDDTELQLLFGKVLWRAGDFRAAELALRDLLARRSLPEARSALANVLLETGRLKEAEQEALESVTARPGDATATETLVAILLARGRPDDARPFIRVQRSQSPGEQSWIAYEATAARLLGDPLYGELYDYDRLVRSFELEAPDGWSSTEELNAALLTALDVRHPFKSHPLDQSVRNGSQTARNLLTDPDSAIRAVIEAFRGPLESYMDAIGSDPGHALAARNTSRARIAAAWSVRLHREGFHVNHVHPQGWISSAYYVSVPAEAHDTALMSGWIKFGEPRHAVPGATAERFVRPKPGRLVLFPSYMWHGTNPIRGTEPRTTIAFDAVPASRR